MAKRTEDEKEILTLKQKKFCELYTSEGDTFGNGTLSYALAYDYPLEEQDETRLFDEAGKVIYGSSARDKMASLCASGSSINLRKPLIRDYIDILLVNKLNDTVVDSQLAKLLLNARKEDVRLNSIKVYNDLKQRITKKIDITTANRPLGNLSDEELKKMLGE